MSGTAPQNFVHWLRAERKTGSPWATTGSPGRTFGPLASAAERTLLTQTIVSEIVPYLATLDRIEAIRSAVDDDEIEYFASLLVTDAREQAEAEVVRLRNIGLSCETIYLELFTPTARLLGQKWLDDGCSSVDVAVGVGCMQRILRTLSANVCFSCRETRAGRRVLLGTLLDEQHSFGLSILTEFFERSSWEVRSLPRAEASDFVSLVRVEWFDVVGLSAGSEVKTSTVAACLRTVRRLSRNPQAKILVGGAAFLANPGRALDMGADATATDARDAVRQAEYLRLQNY
jgi:methanogenic corrinoid protein MtbC1